MAWTYNLSSLGTSPLFQVRYLMGDTVQTQQQVQDEEITFALTQRSSIYGTAAMVCRSLASRLAREADTVDKDIRTTLSARSRGYLRMSIAFEQQASARSGALPYAGGISIADKLQNELDADRVPPNFSIGLTDDDFMPVSPVGNETTTDAAAAAADETQGEI